MNLFRFSTYTNALRLKLSHIDVMATHGEKFSNAEANNVVQMF